MPPTAPSSVQASPEHTGLLLKNGALGVGGSTAAGEADGDAGAAGEADGDADAVAEGDGEGDVGRASC